MVETLYLTRVLKYRELLELDVKTQKNNNEPIGHAKVL